MIEIDKLWPTKLAALREVESPHLDAYRGWSDGMKPMIIDLGLKPEKGYDNQHQWLGEAVGTCVPQRAPLGSPGGSKNRSSAEITVLLGVPDTKPRRYV